MKRALNRRMVVLMTLASAHGVLAASNDSMSEALQRFLAGEDAAPYQYRALRHFEAHTQKLDKSAWMEVWTEADRSGFRYEIAAEGGSGSIRNKVFRETLEAEREMWERDAA